MLEEKITLDKLVRWTISGLLILAVYFVTNSMSEVLLPFFIACLLAYLLYPLVKFTEKYLHIRIRALSILFVVLVLAGLLTGIGLLIVPSMIEQFDKISELAARYLGSSTPASDLSSYIQNWLREHQEDIDRFVRSKDFNETLRTTMPKLFNLLGSTTSFLLRTGCVFSPRNTDPFGTNWHKTLRANSIIIFAGRVWCRSSWVSCSASASPLSISPWLSAWVSSLE